MKENCPLREGECVFRSYKRLLGRNDSERPLKRGASLIRIDKIRGDHLPSRFFAQKK